jgi:hypothetical protein
MLAAGEDPGEAGLMGPKWFPSATPHPGVLGYLPTNVHPNAYGDHP